MCSPPVPEWFFFGWHRAGKGPLVGFATSAGEPLELILEASIISCQEDVGMHSLWVEG